MKHFMIALANVKNPQSLERVFLHSPFSLQLENLLGTDLDKEREKTQSVQMLSARFYIREH